MKASKLINLLQKTIDHYGQDIDVNILAVLENSEFPDMILYEVYDILPIAGNARAFKYDYNINIRTQFHFPRLVLIAKPIANKHPKQNQ